MLRNQHKSAQLLKQLFPIMQQRRLIQQQKAALCNKNTGIIRQGKIMGKLFGHRVSGSKKRWFPSPTDSTTMVNPNMLFKQSNFGKAPSAGGKNSTRRMTVLNKLFMEHITDLLATGEISENILGKGLQISRVKISQDFAYVNVFWLTSDAVDKDAMLEEELQRCAGLLRHELSQLSLMGVVPRIKFVKDKFFNNLYQVENILRNMDFESYEEEEQLAIDLHNADVLKQNFYGSKIKEVTKQEELTDNKNMITNNEHLLSPGLDIPEMRHDVFGLDHKGVMLKILTKMRKSKQAWDQHLQSSSLQPENTNSTGSSSTIPSTSFTELAKINEKLAKVTANSEKFDAFLAKRRERRNTPERKKFRVSDHQLDDINAGNEHDQLDEVMPTCQHQLFEAEDYLYDDLDDKQLK